MSTAANLYTPLAVILFFTMITTLRFSIAGTLKTANAVLRLLTHPAWLYALVLAGGYTLGAFYHGTLSPWPLATFQAVSASGPAFGPASRRPRRRSRSISGCCGRRRRPSRFSPRRTTSG